jgi:tryptophan-rich sensory protein
MIGRLLVFFLLNFGALALGGLFTGSGVVSDWYLNINKAPWTPPGWVFGAAWTTIMVAFTYFMAELWGTGNRRTEVLVLFVLQWILNVGWNPLFFHLRWVQVALISIVALTVIVFYFLLAFRTEVGWKAAAVLPYAIWLVIASSLNAYIVVKN